MDESRQATADVLFAGATGLVGGLAMPGLLARAQSAGFDIWSPVRRETGLRHPRLRGIRCDLPSTAGQRYVEQWLQQGQARLDVFACCLGTTLKAAGSRQAFEAVDLELVLRLARLAHQHGARHAVVMSSVGASPRSRSFYLRVKGRMEQELGQVGFQRIDILRPSLLLGHRSQPRGGEQLGQRLSRLYNGLLLGPLRDYRAIPAQTVAEALVELCRQSGNGIHVHHHDALLALARGASR
ncbi:hypothetical protein [Pseudoxanthomonas dokdonensis]|uniref:Nucleoside-diphosphate sugar epimerase n=1 Tax=Pseudoxanthomonas dokdonensis TaxID=344882 RepID=A0A0R0CGD6_9GAMM|nr:hypothetical protein [Pseudoxanthomonas dokdonensis]KRG68845.1 hypothetical protein ABB29_10175 [Pseudoxanthomonas dokdonensis]